MIRSEVWSLTSRGRPRRRRTPVDQKDTGGRPRHYGRIRRRTSCFRLRPGFRLRETATARRDDATRWRDCAAVRGLGGPIYAFLRNEPELFGRDFLHNHPISKCLAGTPEKSVGSFRKNEPKSGGLWWVRLPRKLHRGGSSDSVLAKRTHFWATSE